MREREKGDGKRWVKVLWKKTVCRMIDINRGREAHQSNGSNTSVLAQWVNADFCSLCSLSSEECVTYVSHLGTPSISPSP